MEERDRSRFWELVLSNILGTAAGCMIAYYASSRKVGGLDRYLDKGIGFLEGMKKKAGRPGYGNE